MSTFNVEHWKGVLRAYIDFGIRVRFAFPGINPPNLNLLEIKEALSSGDPIGFIRTKFNASTCHTIEYVPGTPASPAGWQFTNDVHQREFLNIAPKKIKSGPFAESNLFYFLDGERPVAGVCEPLEALRARFGFYPGGRFAEGPFGPKTSAPFRTGGLEFLVAISAENGQGWCEHLSGNPEQLAANVDEETRARALQDLTPWFGTIGETGEVELRPPVGWTLWPFCK